MLLSESAAVGWADWVKGWQWEWFCTMTFRERVHPERAHKLWRWVVRGIDRELYGPQVARRAEGLQWVRALEFQRRGVIHYHALARRTRGYRRLTVMDLWKDVAGYAKVEAVRNVESVSGYCSKYVVKGGDLDVGGWRSDEMRASLLSAYMLPQMAMRDRRSGNLAAADKGTTPATFSPVEQLDLDLVERFYPDPT